MFIQVTRELSVDPGSVESVGFPGYGYDEYTIRMKSGAVYRIQGRDLFPDAHVALSNL